MSTKAESSHIEKDYNGPFELDANKLNRFAAILEEAFPGTTLTIEIFLKDGKKEHFNSFAQLLAHDNTVRNPISQVRILVDRKEDEYDYPAELSFASTSYHGRRLSVYDPDPRKAAQVFAALEEQFERTTNRAWIMRLRTFDYDLVFPVGIFVLMVLLVVLNLGYQDVKRGKDQLAAGELAEIERKATQAQTPEEKLNVLFEIETQDLRRIRAAHEANSVPSRFFNWKAVLAIGPPVLILIIIFVAVRKLYPPWVFNWGDFQTEYSRLLSWRDRVWTGVVLGFVLNIVANIVFLGLST